MTYRNPVQILLEGQVRVLLHNLTLTTVICPGEVAVAIRKRWLTKINASTCAIHIILRLKPSLDSLCCGLPALLLTKSNTHRSDKTDGEEKLTEPHILDPVTSTLVYVTTVNTISTGFFRCIQTSA